MSLKKKAAENNLSIEIEKKTIMVKEAEQKSNTLKDTDLVDISEIQSSLEKQKLMNTQLYLIQKQIFNNINKRDYVKAAENISNYRSIIYLESNNALPGILEKRESADDLLIIIDDYISFKQTLNKNRNNERPESQFLTELHILFSRIIFNYRKNRKFQRRKKL